MIADTFYSKYLRDCIAEAELHEFFSRELGDAGYASCELRRTSKGVEITVQVADQDIAQGENHYRAHQLESIVAQRLGLDLENVTIWVEKIFKRGLSAEVMVDNLRAKLEEAIPLRRAAYSVIKSVMRVGAVGCEVVIAGKLRAQRAKAQKFKEGYLLATGHPKHVFVSEATRHIKMRQGVIGITVKIYNPNIKFRTIPDDVIVYNESNKPAHAPAPRKH